MVIGAGGGGLHMVLLQKVCGEMGEPRHCSPRRGAVVAAGHRLWRDWRRLLATGCGADVVSPPPVVGGKDEKKR